MKPWRIFSMSALLILPVAVPASAVVFNHSAFDGIVRHYVDEDGYVDYDSIRLNSLTALESYFEDLANADLAGWPAAERQAFWINAYNARVLYKAAQKPGLRKISDDWALFESPFKVAGRLISPGDIKRLLRQDGDPRVLFALSDGTVGGPKLGRVAYTADALGAMLQTNALAFTNSPQAVKVAHGSLQLSSLFKWYAKDFAKAGGAQAYISSMLLPDERGDFDTVKQLLATADGKASFIYDWTLNDQKNRPPDPQRQTLAPQAMPPDALSASNADLSQDR